VNKALQEIVLILQAKTWKIALGSGTTPAWVDNLTLENEVEREDAVVSLGTTYLENDTLIFDATFNFATSQTVSEVGVFCEDGTPFMLDRMQFNPMQVPENTPFPVKMAVPIRRP
jgi:hypothetical protein